MKEFVVIALIAIFALSGLGSIFLIGEPRKPITPGIAAVTVLIQALFVIAVLFLARSAS